MPEAIRAYGGAMPRRNRPARPSASPDGQPIPVELERFVAGGLALGREGGGRVVLAEGGLPGESVLVVPAVDKATLVRGSVVRLDHPAPGRVSPPCAEVAAGCGGCDLQHAGLELQRELKVEVVRDALARIGRLRDVKIAPGEHLPGDSYRTVLRCAVEGDRAGLRRRRSNEVHVLDGCLVAHGAIERVLVEARFPGAEQVTIRVGARTADALVVVEPSARGCVVPVGTSIVGADELDAGAQVHIHELVGRRRLRISARSFFQARPDGAEALVRAVSRALGGFDPRSGRLADLYGGVGLFSAVLGATDGVLVERSESAASDAEHNLRETGTRVVRRAVEDWDPEPVDAVVADPSRAGLGSVAADVVAATGAAQIALVSCDPAALARDARLLVDRGYAVRGVELVDMFPHTHHIEAVTTLVLDRPPT